MWSETRQESPLVGLQPALSAADRSAPEAFRIVERPFLELVNLRGDVRSDAFVKAVTDVLGAPPPASPNTVVQGREHLLIWLGPDEWLLQSTAPAQALLAGRLRPALQGQFATVVDVSSGYTVLELSGRHARDVLQKGCPLDLHPRVFGAGQCAQSHFFKAGVLLRPIEGGRCELVVRRSFADHVGRILLDAATEYLG